MMMSMTMMMLIWRIGQCGWGCTWPMYLEHLQSTQSLSRAASQLRPFFDHFKSMQWWVTWKYDDDDDDDDDDDVENDDDDDDDDDER